MKKAAAMLDGSDSIHRYHRIYYAYIRNNFSTASSSSGSSSVGSALMDEASNTANGSNPLPSNSNASSNAVAGSEVELVFGRPFVLAQLGQYIMEVKRNLLRKDGGWTGSQLLPLILLSERHDGTYLVMGISPFVTTNTNIDKDNEDNNKGRLAPLINFRQFFKLAAKDMMIPFRSNCKYF